MTTETVLLRLPVRLSDLINEVVERFVELHTNERVQAYQRYHGADLWMVYRHEPVGELEPAFLTRRVTIAAYSNDPDHLRFIPDIVVNTPRGRYTLEYDPHRDGLGGSVDAISVLQAQLVSDRVPRWGDLVDEHYLGSIAGALARAWDTAKRLKSEQATQP
ncbi:MAG: hypothetical protein HYX51_07855, partial [Chloroflexi bacterium]|nr:hypothetical protein [Chloroflexota bacterium]